MKANLCPDFPVYVTDWLASTKVSLMTPAEEGGYFRLLCHAWSDPDCCIPADDNALAQLSRLGTAWHDGSGQRIRACFVTDPKRPGFMFNERQRVVRGQQTQRVEKSRKQRSEAAKSRWSKTRKLASEGDTAAFGLACGRNAVEVLPQNGSNASYSTCSDPLLNRQSFFDKGEQASTHPVKKLKLTVGQKESADRFESALSREWVNDAGKWITRIKTDPTRTDSVLRELESAIKEGRSIKTRAGYAEDLWKRFHKIN